MTARIGSLCTGYGGLDLAVMSVLGGSVAWHAEIDPAAARVLAHHHPGVPNHGDLTATDWATAEPVDAITAGWPCQPWSTAGRRLGQEDPRAIWPAIARAIRLVRPRLVVLENVARVVAAGELERVVTDLAALGYVGSWTCLRASDVGAPHRRERLFIVAVADTEGDRRGEGWPEPARLLGRSDPAVGGRAAAADAGRVEVGQQSVAEPRRSGTAVAGLDHPTAADTDGAAPDWGRYGPAIHRWADTLGRPAPAPTVVGRRGGRQLNAWFVEWLMGLPDGWVCDVPGLTRNDQLRLLGNGVVPQQGAAAIRWLVASLDADGAETRARPVAMWAKAALLDAPLAPGGAA